MHKKRDPEVIVNLIKLGVYDYIALDRDPVEIRHKISKAYDAVELKKFRKIHEKELSLLDGFYSVRQNTEKSGQLTHDATLISSIRVSFTQGAGIGPLLSLISMITESFKPENDNIVIDKHVVTMIKENAHKVKRVIDAFESLEKFSRETQQLSPSPLDAVHNLIRNEVNQIVPVAQKFDKEIKLNEQNQFRKKNIQLNSSYMQIIMQELLFNALKFSKNMAGSPGIPDEYKTLIFNPFFRLSRLVFEEIPTLDFGLGLTLVKILVRKLQGSIRVANLENHAHLNAKPSMFVSMEIWLPLYDDIVMKN